MRRRAGPLAAALAVVALALLAAGVQSEPGDLGRPDHHDHRRTPRRPRRRRPAGTWSKAIRIAPGANLTVVSCPAAGTCVVRVGDRADLPALLRQGRPRSGPPCRRPRPRVSPTCRAPAPSFCAAAPNLNQVALFNGSAWQPPATIPAAQGFTAIDCTGPTFCITIDGEGNSFEFDGSGWSGNLGAWGAANQISCVSPSFCVAAEGGPSVWNGHTWTQPNDADTAGQLNSVSCASTSFCVAGGQQRRRPDLERPRPSPRRLSIATEPPLTGTDASGLTAVSCPTPTFCRAVDSIGRVFGWNGTTWSSGHAHRQRPRPHRHLVPDHHLLRRGRPLRQRVRLRLAPPSPRDERAHGRLPRRQYRAARPGR